MNAINDAKADLVIGNCSQILTCQDKAQDIVGLLQNGWIAIADEKIAAIGKRDEVTSEIDCSEAEYIDASGKVVAPGFVDCHTHVVFGGSRVKEYAARLTINNPGKLKEMGIETGIMVSVDMTRSSLKTDLYNATVNRMYRMLKNGTTTIESKSGYGLSTSDEINMLKINESVKNDLPLDIIPTFLGAHGWPTDISKEKYIEKLIHEMIPWVGKLELAKFCDVWCDDGYYTAEESRKILEAAREHGMEPKIHTDAYSYIYGSDLSAEMRMTSADHLNYTPRDVFKKLADAEVTGVLLPALDFAVKHPKPFNPRPMIESGMTIALATNCCPGCWTESMQFVMSLACRRHGLSPAEAIKAATLGGAKALKLQHDRGSLEKGKLADIQIWDIPEYEHIVYRLGGNVVEKVIKKGKVVVENVYSKF